MTVSDEFIPNTAELQAFLAAALTPEISRASADLGVESTYSAHAFARGKETLLLDSAASAWTVRATFRASHSPGRALVQLQAKLAAPHPSGYSGFTLKGGYDLGSPNTFAARSKTNEYNTAGFRAWA
ncbi:hypothetical protein H9L17_04915 [Thermomonas brevis]|uniref:Uncharacterized protein n=1 Tax=Thermomonas brevis TaxID=215691 RepID=A0A7G9QVV7_9GAMM|nr:hypothetical protein [Thermomonas brevis]QNN47482.1 hypothetical protein H9L17_04915 [Thermomonas brevis]